MAKKKRPVLIAGAIGKVIAKILTSPQYPQYSRFFRPGDQQNIRTEDPARHTIYDLPIEHAFILGSNNSLPPIIIFVKGNDQKIKNILSQNGVTDAKLQNELIKQANIAYLRHQAQIDVVVVIDSDPTMNLMVDKVMGAIQKMQTQSIYVHEDAKEACESSEEEILSNGMSGASVDTWKL